MFGQVEIKRGLKRLERERTLPVTRQMRDAILAMLSRSGCEYVFTSVENPKEPLSPFTLASQLRRTRTTLRLDPDAGLHALRHTFLTEMGRITDAFTLQKIAGHARITTTQRYVHPQQEAVKAAFAAKAGKVPTISTTVTTPPENYVRISLKQRAQKWRN